MVEKKLFEDLIEKAKKSSPVGTEKTWGGKVYIKTSNGWRPKGKDKKSSEEDNSLKDKKTDSLEYASKASDEQLNAALKDKDASEEVREAAKKELENRRSKTEENKGNEKSKEIGISSALQRILDAQEKGELDLDEEIINKIKDKIATESKKKEESKPIDEKTLDSKLEKLKDEIAENIDNKLNEMNGFKKITQTYIKSNGQTIVLNMKGDDKYKAKKGSFYMESKPYESLVDFKKRVKEAFEKTQDKEEPKQEKEIIDEFAEPTIKKVENGTVKIEPKEVMGKTQYDISTYDSKGNKVGMTTTVNKKEDIQTVIDQKAQEIPVVNKKEEQKEKPITKVSWKLPNSHVIQWSKIKSALDSGIAEVERKGIRYHIEKESDSVFKVKNLDNNQEATCNDLFDLPTAMIETEKSEPAIENKIHFKNVDELYNYIEKRNKVADTLNEDQSKKLDDVLKSLPEDNEFDKEMFEGFIQDRNFSELLRRYAGQNELGRAKVSQLLLDSGYLPVANGVLYHNYNGNEYKHFIVPIGSPQADYYKAEKYYKEQGSELKGTKKELGSIAKYMGTAYRAIRKYNYGQSESSTIEQNVINIENLINKNPCKENIVLNRRVELSDLNGLNSWLSAEIGSIVEDKSFSSFSLKQLRQFGNDLQITLLAKKGDKVTNVNNHLGEMEYVVQRNSKYKVIAKGTNSIVVELV